MEDPEDLDQEARIKQMFDDFDKDKNQTIDRSELELALRSLNLAFTQADIEEYMEQLDQSKNGDISYEEFRLFIKDKLTFKAESQLGEIFDMLDRDEDQAIGALEVRYALYCLGEEISEEDAECMIKAIRNADKISKAEFINYMMGKSD